MQISVWQKPDDVEATLVRLGLSLAPLQRAVVAGHVSRISRTANDAPNAAGFYQWNETLRVLREELIPTRWERRDDGNLPTIMRPDHKVSLAVSSGNQSTGKSDETPQTRGQKGASTAAVVYLNRQLELFPARPRLARPEEGTHQTWVLLYYATPQELRSELSLPVSMSVRGHISEWTERIILPVQPLEPETAIRPEPDFGPDVEITIQRRA